MVDSLNTILSPLSPFLLFLLFLLFPFFPPPKVSIDQGSEVKNCRDGVCGSETDVEKKQSWRKGEMW